MSQIKKVGVMKTIMTGISYMIPMVVAGGILGALAKGFGGWEIGNYYSEVAGTWATPPSPEWSPSPGAASGGASTCSAPMP